MYQAGAMLTSEYLMDAIANGRLGGRIGNRHPHRAPQGCYPALGDDQWITLSVGSDEQWLVLCELMARDDLARDPDFAGVSARLRNHDRIDEAISAWTAGVDKYQLMHRLQARGIPAGPVLTGKDVHFDPHYKSRGFLERVTYPPERKMGTRLFIGRPYKFSGRPLRIRGPSPTFGQDNQPLLQDLLGVDQASYQALVQDAVIATVPTAGGADIKVPPAQAVEQGLLAAWDPDYRARLDI